MNVFEICMTNIIMLFISVSLTITLFMSDKQPDMIYLSLTCIKSYMVATKKASKASKVH